MRLALNKQIQRLYLVRGLPNSGKTELAEELASHNYAADQFYDALAARDGISYQEAFNPSLIGEAHTWCKARTKLALRNGYDVAVHNTFTTKSELQPYLDMAAELDVQVTVITVERNHDGDNGHQVPQEVIEEMAARWEHVDSRF